MKRILFTGLSALVLSAALVPTASASESATSQTNFDEPYTTVYDSRSQMTQEKQAGKPPSGDSNPSDRHNRTVDTRDIINPQQKSAGKPPSGDSNPSDRHNRTINTSEIINPQPGVDASRTNLPQR